MGDEVSGNMTKAEFSYLLPPAAVSESFSTLSTVSRETQTAFNALLRTPFLQEIRVASSDDVFLKTGVSNTDAAVAKASLYPLITEGLANFAAIQTMDVTVARKLSGYAATLPLIAQSLPREKLASVLLSMVGTNVENVNRKSESSKAFFTSFSDTLRRTSVAIDSMDVDLEKLRNEIAGFNRFQAESEPDSSMFSRAKQRLGKYMANSTGSDSSFFAALGALLSVAVDELQKMFSHVDETKVRESLLDNLKQLQSRVRDVRLLLTALLDSLSVLLRTSLSTMTVWYDISADLTRLSKTTMPGEKFSKAETQQIKEAWQSIKKDADAFTESVSDKSSESVLKLGLAARAEVSRSLSLARAAATSASSVFPSSVSDAQKDAVMKIMADEEVPKALEQLTATSGKIVASFNNMLKIPFLDSLKVSNSAVTGTNADGSNEKPNDNADSVDLEQVALNYLRRYQKLQAETVPIARSLYGYATLQTRLIPMLGKQVSVESYVKANMGIITKHREEAARVHQLHNKFQQDWNTAILLVERAIAEQESSIDGLKTQIESLVKKHRDMTIGAVFATIGAAIFTAAAFATGGLLLVLLSSLAVGSAVTAGVLISEAVKLQDTINAYRQALKTAEDALEKLKFVLPFMREIAGHLQEVTGVWNDIANKLTAIETNVETWETLVLFGGEQALQTLLGVAAADWKIVADMVLKYVAQVSDANPEAK